MLLDPKRNYILDLVHFSENDPLLKASAYVSLVCGCAQLLVGFLGLCGAVNRSRFLLLAFVMFLIGTFLADVAMGTLSLFYKDKFSNNYMGVYLKNLTYNRYSRDRWVLPLMDTIQFYVSILFMVDFKISKVPASPCLLVIVYSVKENVREIVKSKYGVMTSEPENKMVTEFIDKLQFYHQCCGGEGPLDYKDSFWYITNTLRGTRSFVPPSCCKQAQVGRAWAPVPIDPMCTTYRYLTTAFDTSVNTVVSVYYVFLLGCSERLMSWFNEQIWIFVGFGFGSALTMMLGICLSCCLISKIRIYHVIRDDY
nr:hypothetical protein C02F12.1 - Caenorhabditis elegans [Caenorhabditis elegans]